MVGSGTKQSDSDFQFGRYGNPMKNKRKSIGQSLVEFAVILPIVLLLLLGFLDMARALMYYSVLTNSVREATRNAIVMDYEVYKNTPNTFITNIKQKVWDSAVGIPNAATNVAVTVVVTTEGGDYTKISIKANYTFRPVTPGITLITGSSGIPLEAKSVMRLEPGSR